jgi:hypothetical protein
MPAQFADMPRDLLSEDFTQTFTLAVSNERRLPIVKADIGSTATPFITVVST